MPSPPPRQDLEPILALRDASRLVVEGVNHSYPAFRRLSLAVYPGERLGVFGVNGTEARTLVGCLSGVEPLDSGTLEQQGSVSWPLGTNDAFSGKLSGYVNARFAAEVYSNPGQIEEDLKLIQELAAVPDEVYHEPLGDWPSALKDSLKLAVSLAFDFDVITVGRISGWNHRHLHPHSVKIRECFERRIDGRTLLIAANGQNRLALDYCDEGLVLFNGDIIYRGDPKVCLELMKEETRRQKQLRRERVNQRIAELTGDAAADEDDDEADGQLDPGSGGEARTDGH